MVLQVLLQCVFVDPQDLFLKLIQGQSSIGNLQTNKSDLLLCCKVQATLRCFHFNTVPSVELDMFKSSISVVDPQV